MSSSMTLGEGVRLFLASHKPRTRESYGYVLHNMARFVGESKLLTDINPLHLAEYKLQLDRRDYRDGTFNKYVKDVRALFNWLVRHRFIETSPAVTLKTRRTEHQVPRDKAMSEDHVKLLLAYTRWRPRDCALLTFLLDTGCRAGGAAGLRWTDVDLAKLEALVTEKGNKTRTVWYGEPCAAALRDWQQRQRGKSIYVFSRSPQPLAVASLSQIIQRACIAVGVPPKGAHSLRHRKGYQLADARIAPSVAAAALGHTAVMTTLQHYYPADTERARQAMAELATPPQPVAPPATTSKTIPFPRSG